MAPPGRAERRRGAERKPREERWSEIVQIATEVFYEKGYEAASLQDLADKLGMLKGSLYYYIQTKEDLLYEVINGVHQGGLDNLKSLASGEEGALERLRNVVVGHVEYECDHLIGTTVFLHELDALPAERRLEIIGEDHAYRGLLTELIETGQAEGVIRPDVVPKLAALWVLGSVNWAYRWFVPGGEFTPRAIGDHFADLIIRGLATADALPASAPARRPRASRSPVSKASAGRSRTPKGTVSSELATEKSAERAKAGNRKNAATRTKKS
jgi:AcrR family transcriptional regulator